MHHPLSVARLSCNLPYTFLVLFLPRLVPAFSGSGEVWKQGERTESRLESISLLRHQCFTVGTLLIALLYNYSTSTPSVCLWHRSCFQFLSRSPGLHPLFPLPFFVLFLSISLWHHDYFSKSCARGLHVKTPNQLSDTVSLCLLMLSTM